MNMVDDKITLDKKSFEALAADTRVGILKALAERQKTLTELAAQFNLSPSTVKEHMQVLEGAGLVMMKDEGRKWKYYELTWKGKNIVQPRELKIWIVLGISAILLVGALFMLVSKLSTEQLTIPGIGSPQLPNVAIPMPIVTPSGGSGGTGGVPDSAGIVGGEGIVAVGMPSLEFGTEPVLTSLVKGCAETGQPKEGAEERASEVERPADLKVEGGILTYSRALRHACCLHVELAKEISGSGIKITEEWTGEMCKCICFSEVGATLENLPAGKYTVSVYELGSILSEADGQERLVISKEVEVG